MGDTAQPDNRSVPHEAVLLDAAMEALLESGQAKSGDSALIIGFGAGLVFAGQTLILP